MHPLAVALVLGSAIIHAWRELITKKAYDKQIFIWIFCMTSIVVFFPLFLYKAAMGEMTSTVLLLSLGGAIVHAVYWYWMSRAYEGGDLSHVYPIMRSAPALVFVLSVLFLHEHVSVVATIGVVTIVLGVYMINMKKFSLQGFLEPLESFRERHTRYALLTACAVTAYSIQDKIMMEHVDPLLYAYLLGVFPAIYWTPFILRTKTRAAIVREWKRKPTDVILNSIIGTLSYALILTAFTFERVSYVTSLRQISIVFGVFLGGHLLKERHKIIRLSAAGLILIGTVMIAVAPS